MGDRPEAFRLVDLKDRHTWQNATIQDWIDLRRSLLAKLPSDRDRERLLKRNIGLHRKASKQLEKEEKARGHSLGPYFSGRQKARYRQILNESLTAKDRISTSLTNWESDFLKASTWIDEIERSYREHDDRALLISTLFEWCWHSDEARADILNRARAQHEGSVSQHSGTGLLGGRNAYLPESVELLQLFRLAYLLIAHLRNGAEIAAEYNMTVDEFGAAFPCPKCGEKYEYAYYAEQCCGVHYDAEASDSLTFAIPISSPSYRTHMDRFFDLLWRFGYDTPAAPDDMQYWDNWASILCSTPAQLTIQFLAAVFHAQPETVRRRLTKKNLNNAYKKYNIDSDLRDYLGKDRLGAYAELRPRGWYLDTINGKPAGPIEGKRMAVFKWHL